MQMFDDRKTAAQMSQVHQTTIWVLLVFKTFCLFANTNPNRCQSLTHRIMFFTFAAEIFFIKAKFRSKNVSKQKGIPARSRTVRRAGEPDGWGSRPGHPGVRGES